MQAYSESTCETIAEEGEKEEQAGTTHDEPAHGVEDASSPFVVRKVTDNILIFDSKEKCHWCPTSVDKIDYLPAEERADVLDGLIRAPEAEELLDVCPRRGKGSVHQEGPGEW